jgi:hypothetical protein
MTKKNPTNLGSGTHVVFDSSGADYLLKLGGTNLVRVCESPAVGPSRRDVVEHAQVRQAWYRSTETWDHLYSPEVRWNTPVVVWVTPCLRDRPNLWRTCSWLRDKGISHGDILIVDLPPRPRNPGAVPRTEPFGCGNSVFEYHLAEIQTHLAAVRSWPRERYDQAVKLWEQFVDPDPRHFARRCRKGVPGFPELGSIWEFFSRFFPRLSADRSLHLSRYDELLLRTLSARWKTPVDVWISDTIQRYWDFFFCVGDLGMARRLAAWAEHGARPALERAPGPRGPENVMLSSVYRLTKRGREIRVQLPEVGDAPRFPVGGAEAYAPEAPWVLRYDGRLTRL